MVNLNKTRNAKRAATVAVGTVLLTLVSSPAFALIRDDGDDPGPGLSVFETLTLFVLAPIVIFALITGAVVLLGDRRK
ncbi:hypothetical protein [Streptomyces hainanensis]|uniref:Secreted protein n=1 Tax=Streptomyces hainanensis TaxID=402648 RepID=A0A4R4TFF7_9ACTN|nr:hypothetical protein E1283_13810 [Streptomyces hainanensis]